MKTELLSFFAHFLYHNPDYKGAIAEYKGPERTTLAPGELVLVRANSRGLSSVALVEKPMTQREIAAHADGRRTWSVSTNVEASHLEPVDIPTGGVAISG